MLFYNVQQILTSCVWCVLVYTIASGSSPRVVSMLSTPVFIQCLATDADRSLSPIDADGRRENDVT